MTTGVAVADECVTKFNEIKMQHNLRYVIYKIENKETIIVEHTGEKSETYDDFVSKLPNDEPRYAVVDFQYETDDGRPQEKLLFLGWSPDTCNVKLKMLYASSKEAIKKKVPGVSKELQVNDASDLRLSEVSSFMKRK
eukprot:Platyproteum_vivax@DN1652_c0_g1_i1.p1